MRERAQRRPSVPSDTTGWKNNLHLIVQNLVMIDSSKLIFFHKLTLFLVRSSLNSMSECAVRSLYVFPSPMSTPQPQFIVNVSGSLWLDVLASYAEFCNISCASRLTVHVAWFPNQIVSSSFLHSSTHSFDKCLLVLVMGQLDARSCDSQWITQTPLTSERTI